MPVEQAPQNTQNPQNPQNPLLGYLIVGDDVLIGDHSYISELSHVSQGTVIGKFCSIGNLCTLGAQPHPMKALSSFPFQRVFQVRKEWQTLGTKIGNDVWIGSNVVVLAGVTIGDGAVIGAGAVVTKDVEPYAVMAGNPARLLRYRFPPEIVDELLEYRWWDLPIGTIETILPYDDIEQSLDVLRVIRSKVAA